MLKRIFKSLGSALLVATLLFAQQAPAQTNYLDRFAGAVIAAIGKAPVDCATTAPITLSGYQTIDGVAEDADYGRVLVNNQTDATTNGIYTVFSGNWVRSSDFAGPSGTVSGQLVYVVGGTTNAGLWQLTTENPVQIDQSGGQTTPPSDITFEVLFPASGIAQALAAEIAAAASATSATSSATSAAASAVAAGSSLYTTSSTSNTIGTGNFTFTVPAHLNFQANQPIIASQNGTATNYIYGVVSSYSGTSLVITEQSNGGTGTITNWNIAASGIQGPTGPSGGVTTTGSPTSGELTKFSGGTSITNGNLSGDITTTNTLATTLATVNTSPATYGTNIAFPSALAINGKGLVTSATVYPIQYANGFLNKFRNPGMDVWQRGTNITATSSYAYTADGWQVVATGANVTVAEYTTQFATCCTNSMQISGANSNTDVSIKERIESSIASGLSNQTDTAQFWFVNASGANLAPKVTVKHAGSVDSWGSPVTDVSAQSMNSILNGSNGVVAYTFTGAAGSANGLEITFDFGPIGSGDNIYMTAFDLRATPGMTTGIQTNPPNPEYRPLPQELPIDYRYFYSTYGNGVAPGTATSIGIFGSGLSTTAVTAFAQPKWPVPMFTTPTFSYWDTAGTASKYSTLSSTTFTAGNAIGGSGTITLYPNGAIFWIDTTSANAYYQFTVSSEL